MRRVLLGVLGLALLLVGLPGGASADSAYGSVSGISGVLYDDCLDQPYAYSVDVPDGGSYRAIRASLYAPDGSRVGTDFVAPAANVASGTSTFRLCRPGDAYGTYTIRATVEWASEAGQSVTSATLAPTRFTMRKPHSRTSAAASTLRPASGQSVTWRVRSYVEQPSGYGRNAFAWVHLEKRVGSHWVRVKGARAMTHATGGVRIRLRHPARHQRMLLRAVTEPTSRFARSTSPVVRLW